MTFERIARLTDASEVADIVATRLLDRLVELQTTKGVVHVCLTGGDAANMMYERFAELAPQTALDTSLLQLWWGDERFVPATDPDRNSLQAVARLARTVPIKSADIHMMPAADGRLDADQCAAEYEAELGGTTFDITLLGIGRDGHIGSIFPGHPSFDPTTKSVIGVTDSPKPPPERITLTIPTFNRSDEIWFLASGGGKADAIARCLDRDPALPASHVRGVTATYWFIDDAAAAGLPKSYHCDL